MATFAARFRAMATALAAMCLFGAQSNSPRMRPLPAVSKDVVTGPAVGAPVPAFRLADQDGRLRDFASLAGPNGLLLAFVRSADWCPYCKAQLVEFGQQVKEFERRGIHVAAVTYDTPAILAHFARRMSLDYPLLADPKSEAIRAFGILNTNVPEDSPFYGVPFPVTYLLDRKGVVRKKYFEEDYRERLTSAAILTREFHVPGTGAVREVSTSHLTLHASASNATVWPGSVVTLRVEIEPRPGMHVYAPDVSGYLPVRWSVTDTPAWAADKPRFPASRKLALPAINETAAVYDQPFVVERELKIGQLNELKAQVGSGTEVDVAGEFFYQACDEKVCYVPQRIPLNFRLKLSELDRQRAPAEVRAGKGPA
jgi:peroxiredoxin